jgi:uncharacterized membrane protein
MAEDTEGGGATGAAEAVADAATPDDGGNGAGEAVGKAKDAAGGDGRSNKLLIGAAIAGATVAAGYAASKAAPKLKQSATAKATDAAGDVADDVASQAEERGGPLGLAAKLAKKGGDSDGGGVMGAVKSVVPGAGGKSKEPSEGWGKGRRNPIQRWVDVAVPLETAYNQWTQFEEFPKFMHRVVSVQQDDNERQKVTWREKIWFKTREWEAQITEQIPDKRIAWKTVSGTRHVGHVSFHRLEDELTRVMVTIDFNPSGMFEKMASGLRFVKRAAESDLCRFKAFIEVHREPTGAWRGRIEDGEVVEDPGVEEGKPFEEGAELRKPETGSDDKKKEKEEGDSRDGGRQEPSAEAESDGGEDADQRAEEREERARRREERQGATVSS